MVTKAVICARQGSTKISRTGNCKYDDESSHAGAWQGKPLATVQIMNPGKDSWTYRPKINLAQITFNHIEKRMTHKKKTLAKMKFFYQC